jgi:hypothetical protein
MSLVQCAVMNITHDECVLFEAKYSASAARCQVYLPGIGRGRGAIITLHTKYLKTLYLYTVQYTNVTPTLPAPCPCRPPAGGLSPA